MSDVDVRLLRAAYAVLRGYQHGWGNEHDANATIESIQAALAAHDAEWLDTFDTIEAKGRSGSMMSSAHGRTLERFNGFLTQLYVIVGDACTDARQAGSESLPVTGIMPSIAPRADEE